MRVAGSASTGPTWTDDGSSCAPGRSSVIRGSTTPGIVATSGTVGGALVGDAVDGALAAGTADDGDGVVGTRSRSQVPATTAATAAAAATATAAATSVQRRWRSGTTSAEYRQSPSDGGSPARDDVAVSSSSA